MRLSDDELYARFLAGDTTAFNELLVRHGDGLVFYLNGCLHDWHDAEDLMVEAFARIMDRRPAIRAGGFRAYLYRTARNLATRLHERALRLSTFSLDELGETVIAGTPLEQLLHERERRRVLHACLGRIDPTLREALWLVYAKGMSYAEAAQVMGVSAKRIDHLLSRGKERMRRELEREGVAHAYG